MDFHLKRALLKCVALSHKPYYNSYEVKGDTNGALTTVFVARVAGAILTTCGSV